MYLTLRYMLENKIVSVFISLILCLTLTLDMVRVFKKSNTFSCLQDAKNIKSKNIVKDQISPTATINFCQILNFN